LHRVLQVQAKENNLPDVTFHGDMRLDGLRTVDGVMGTDLLKWDSLRISGIEINLRPQSVAIREIALDNLYARLVVETNKTINLLNALRLTNTNAPATNDVAAAKPSAAPLPKKTIDTMVISNQTISISDYPTISINTVVVSNATISFSDYSLSPNVNMRVQQAGGTISGISSEERQHADVDLSAAVDGVGPVSITGTINPFSETSTNRIKISAKEIELTPTGPYSAKFAGYRIAEGKLYLDLEYEIIGKKISAKNVITVDQFTFGEQVDSP